MTESELYTSITLVTLLIVGLMGWLKGEFRQMAMTPEEKMAELEILCHDLIRKREQLLDYYQPKRRKHRDNPQRGK